MTKMPIRKAANLYGTTGENSDTVDTVDPSS